MTEFENKINNGKFSTRVINAVINDLKTGDTFDAWINAKTLQEIDSKLPQGFEMDRLATLQNYFNPVTVDKYEIELMNSQYIYFHDFDILYGHGFQTYTRALEKDKMVIVNNLDRQHQK